LHFEKLKQIKCEEERESEFQKVIEVLGSRRSSAGNAKTQVQLLELTRRASNFLHELSHCCKKPAAAVEHLNVLSHFQELSAANEQTTTSAGELFVPCASAVSFC
jgi:hypothetical protein